MAPSISDFSVAVEDHEERMASSSIAGERISEGMDFEECAPIGDREFKTLMGLIVIATIGFGCIVNGWTL